MSHHQHRGRLVGLDGRRAGQDAGQRHHLLVLHRQGRRAGGAGRGDDQLVAAVGYAVDDGGERGSVGIAAPAAAVALLLQRGVQFQQLFRLVGKVDRYLQLIVGEQLVLQLEDHLPGLGRQRGVIARDEQQQAAGPVAHQLPEAGHRQLRHFGHHGFAEDAGAAGRPPGLHGQRRGPGAVADPGQVVLGQPVNVQLGGGLHGVDRRQGDEDGQADQEVVG